MRFKVVGSADDVSFTISEFDVHTLFARMNLALKILSRWSKENGLWINSHKTEIMLFTGKYKIIYFTPPKLDEVQLSLAEMLKHLGVVRNPKLSQRNNFLDRTRKPTVALYTCNQALGKSWGLRPLIVSYILVLPSCSVADSALRGISIMNSGR